jgi:hypothetical protein
VGRDEVHLCGCGWVCVGVRGARGNGEQNGAYMFISTYTHTSAHTHDTHMHPPPTHITAHMSCKAAPRAGSCLGDRSLTLPTPLEA